MSTLCGANCSKCDFCNKCNGCTNTNGKPFGGKCVTAEYIKLGGRESFEKFKQALIDEINLLNIDGLPKIDNLFSLCGSYVNLAYPMPSGKNIKLLNDRNIYLGNQVQSEFDISNENMRCFGILADESFIIICEYGINGTNPELILYKRR